MVTTYIKALKFNNCNNITPINYNRDKPRGKIYKSKIMHMCKIPISIDFLDDNLSDNDFGTLVQIPFTANSSGEVAVMFYAVSPKDAFIDNVKVIAQ